MNYREQLSICQERAKAIIKHAEHIIAELEKRCINVDLYISLDYKISIYVYSLKELNEIRKVLKSIYPNYTDKLEYVDSTNYDNFGMGRAFYDPSGELSDILSVELVMPIDKLPKLKNKAKKWL